VLALASRSVARGRDACCLCCSGGLAIAPSCVSHCDPICHSMAGCFASLMPALHQGGGGGGGGGEGSGGGGCAGGGGAAGGAAAGGWQC